MKIVVVGAGQVGRAVAEGLDDRHEIVVVDIDAERLDQLRYAADVMTYEGDAADVDVLEKAGVADADMIIGSTDDDRTNILVCAVGEALSDDLFSIARVADTDFLKSWRYSREAFNIDYMVGSDYLTAQSLVRIGLRQMAREVEFFDRGRIEVVEFDVPPDSRLAGELVREADIFPGLRYAAVVDDEGLEVVRGDTRIPGGGRLLVIGLPAEMHDLAEALASSEHAPIHRIFVLGGGEVGFQTARLIQERGLNPKLVESDRSRAEYLARNLPESFVLHDDATDPDFLRSEGIDRSQLVISALRPDERNLFAALQAQYLGADRVLSVVHDKDYIPLFDEYGVDATVNPRNKVIEEILRYTRDESLEKVTFLEGHSGEVVQIELDDESALIGRPLKESAADLPVEMVVGAATRGNRTIIPDGSTVFEVGDQLVIYADTEVVSELVERI